MGRKRRITPEQFSDTGRLHERRWLGEIDACDSMAKDIQRLKKPSQNPNFDFWMTLGDSLELVKKYQPIDKSDPRKKRVDPTNPEAPLLRDLRIEMIDSMELTDEQADKLKLYTAVGSPMDLFHGVDAIIDYDGKIVTMDLTLKPSDEGKKADVVVTGDIPDEKSEEYLPEVKKIAASVQTIIKFKRKPGRPQIQKLYEEDRPAA
jgi:hypothetical protein